MSRTNSLSYIWIGCILILPILCYCQTKDQTVNETLDQLDQVYKFKRISNDSIYIQVADSLIELSFQLTNKARYDIARTQIQIADKICQSFVSKDHSIYPKLYYSSTYLFSKLNDMPKADSSGTAAIALLEPYHFENNDHIASIYFLLAYANDLLENRTKALMAIQNAIRIAEKNYGTNSEKYFRFYTGLCNIYKNSGQTEKAMTSYYHLLNLIEKSSGKKNKNYIYCLTNLSNLYLGLDSLSRVEELRTEALKLSEQVFGKMSQESMIALFQLGTYYKNVRQWSKARSMLTQAKLISDSLKGERIFRTRILNNLISLKNPGLSGTEIIDLHLEVLKLVELSFGKVNGQYALALGNLAIAYVNLGRNHEAEQAFNEAIGLYYQLDDQGYDFQKCRSGIAILMFNQGKYRDVIDTLERVIANKIDHHKTRELSFLLADIYLLCHAYQYSDQAEKADSAFRLAEKLMVDKYRQVLRFMSLSEFELYLAEHQYFLSQLLSWYQYKNARRNNIEHLIFNDIMMYKSMVLNQYLKQRAKLNSNRDLKFDYDQFIAGHKLLSEEITKPSGNQIAIDSMKSTLEEMEKNLFKIIHQSGNPLDNYSWEELCDKLLPTEAAIEFVAYDNYLDSMGKLVLNQSSGVSYCALILRKDSKLPTIVSLCTEAELFQCLNMNQSSRMKIYSLVEGSEDTTSSLYNLIWKKIEPHVKDIRKIYFSPAGLLHRINLGAIPISNENQLLDRHELAQLIGTRQLIELLESNKPADGALLVGGIDYEAEPTDSLASHSMAVVEDGKSPEFRNTDVTLRGGTWHPLPGTMREMSAISKILSGHKFDIKLLSGKEGSEDLVKSTTDSDKPYRILHFATHGYFFPDSYMKSDSTGGIKNVFIQSENPMLRSGLILAGGNAGWMGQQTLQGREDGVLTAYEISQMNLSNTELVVLSACETGLGDIKGNEGVYGLQRAFKIAGAKYLIMSLWQVPDRETKEFMVSFYKNWLEKKLSIPEAFRKTQKEMRERFINPFAWAGFVLVE